MDYNPLLPRCVSCPDPPPCNCSPDQDCVRINRDCDTCSQNNCVARTSSGSSGGISKGALAGGIIGSLIFIALAISFYFWYRRTSHFRKAGISRRETKKDVPAPASAVLSRPDPTEKSSSPVTELGVVRAYSALSNSTNVAHSQHSVHSARYTLSSTHSSLSNPFDDGTSIQTTGTEGTNVIPIALVSPESHHTLSPRSDSRSLPSTTSSFPLRPTRTPEMDLNLEHVNISHDTIRANGLYAPSTISGISGMSSRNSYMSNASYSSDFLNEAPMIITPTKGSVRQVVGVVKAEVINAPGSLSPGFGAEGLKKSSSLSSRPSVGSPLASASFSSADIKDEKHNPFSDDNSPTQMGFYSSPTSYLPPIDESPPEWSPSVDSNRPSSMYTQAGSVIDIGSATRVNVGLQNLSPSAIPRSPFRTTMGRLVSPTLSSSSGTLQEQQQKALAHAQAQAQAQGLDKSRRTSGSSVLSATSTRADSILEAFPFVPPSPISDRPARSPPVSPLGQQSFTTASLSPLGKHTFTVAPPSPLSNKFSETTPKGPGDSTDSLPAPPNRRTLGLSTASQLSTASTGLGSFPFQIDHGPPAEAVSALPSSFNIPGPRQRASLDTLALTSDLSSYPLDFDRDNIQAPNNQ